MLFLHFLQQNISAIVFFEMCDKRDRDEKLFLGTDLVAPITKVAAAEKRSIK